MENHHTINDPIDVRPVTREDITVWLPLWKAYQRFYQTRIDEQVTGRHLATLPAGTGAHARRPGLVR